MGGTPEGRLPLLDQFWSKGAVSVSRGLKLKAIIVRTNQSPVAAAVASCCLLPS
jgi:hypothetical protein